MFKVIAIYFYEVSDDPSDRVTETLVHFSDTMTDAQAWACNECFDKGTSYEERFAYVDEHYTFKESSVTECLNALLAQQTRMTDLEPQQTRMKDLEHNLKYAQGMTSADGSVAFTSVKIGDQVWMSKNLAIDDDGDGVYYNPKNKEYYYTWDAAVRIAKDIPGWHLPSVDEWNEACEACGVEPIESGGYVEDARELYDRLKIIPAGTYSCSSGSFYEVGTYARFWNIIESGSSAFSRYFGYGATMGQHTYRKYYGYSVRLVKDKFIGGPYDGMEKV